MHKGQNMTEEITNGTNGIDDIELRFEEPSSLYEAQQLRDTLKQQILELQAAMTVINDERPPKRESFNYNQWLGRRGRRISALRKANQHYAYIREWIVAHERNEYKLANRPSIQLYNIHHTVRKLEDLYRAVGNYIYSEEDEEELYRIMADLYDSIDEDVFGEEK